jgi:hypothetical protein
MRMSRIHDFEERLTFSQSFEDAAWWIDIYRAAFPNVVSATSVRADGWAQRGGIDRVITLSSGKTITVDEKVREKTWPDILLERWSDEKRKAPGWIQKALACDFIAYAFVPTATCYLLPTLTLQRAWRERGRDWINRYPEIRAHNRGWTTVNIPVPIGVLFAAITDAMRVTWTPIAPPLLQPAPQPPPFPNDLEGLPLFKYGAGA